MADIPIKFYKSVVRSQTFNPTNPPDLEEPAPFVNPPGSTLTTLYKLLGDVTDSDFIGKNGFVPVVVDENVLTLENLDNKYVTIATAQTITGAKIFNNALLVLSENNPVLRITSNSNTGTLNFRNVFGEDQAGIILDNPANKFSIATRVSNTDIEIAPHGTGSILLPNVASGTGDVLMLNGSGEVVKGGTVLTETSGTFTVGMSASGGGITYSFTTSIANFKKLGNIVFFELKLTGISSSGTGSGELLISTSLDTSDPASRFVSGVSGFTNSSFTNAQINVLKAILVENTLFVRDLAGTVGIPTFTSSGTIHITGSYISS